MDGRDFCDDPQLDDTQRIVHLDKNRGGKRWCSIAYDFIGPQFKFENERLIVPNEK